MKKKFTVPNQPVRKLWEEKQLPGKHRETCLHGAEVSLWKAEPGERHLPQTQKGDQSQVGGVRAKAEPENRRGWLGVRCRHCHPALQHSTRSSRLQTELGCPEWLLLPGDAQRGSVSATGSCHVNTLSSHSFVTSSTKDRWPGRLKETCPLWTPSPPPAQGTLKFIGLGTNVSKTTPISGYALFWQEEVEVSIKN